MGKIEVLRGALLTEIRNLPDGPVFFRTAEDGPALLAALLEAAGAVKVRLQHVEGRDYYYISALPGETVPESVIKVGHLDPGFVWLLSTPEETKASV